MADYVDPDWAEILDANGLDGFDQLWRLPVDWVEAPNADRGGSSGVGRVVLKTPQGDEKPVYLKRQVAHTRRTLQHPLRGEPTFTREFIMLRHLCQHHVMAPRPVFYATRMMEGEVAAILVTEELSGFKPLDASHDEVKKLAPARRRALLKATAQLVSTMHGLGIQHRSLYEKHLFVKPVGEGYEVAVIDLEKSRFSPLSYWSAILDLSTLNYRSPGWSRSNRLYFFKQYHAVDSLSFWQKSQCKLINRRSADRLERLNR